MAAHPKHGVVRGRYKGCCGYCSVSEEDAGGEFTVDHFIPISDGGDDSDENLVYCCFRCNLYKSNFSPTDDDRGAGHVILHPSHDDPTEHLRLNESTGLLEALTETGHFHITLLHLNRPALVAHRLRRRRATLREARRQLMEAENSELRAIIAAQQNFRTLTEKVFCHVSCESTVAVSGARSCPGCRSFSKCVRSEYA